MAIDVHAHYVPPSILDDLEGRARDFSLSLVRNPPTCQCAIHFDYGLKLRPFFPLLIEPVEKRVDAIERQGVDRQVLSAWTDIFGYGLPRHAGAGWHRFLNERLSDISANDSRHFSFLASVPLPHDADAANELDFAVRQLGAVGAVVGANVDGINLGEVALDEFWQAAVELDVPVLIHPVQAVATQRGHKFGLNQIVQYACDTAFSAGSMIFSGLLDRFPGLRPILCHGGGAFPYLIGRFDCMHARMDKTADDCAVMSPSAYLSRFHFDTILHDARLLRMLAELVSVERIVLGTDYSFPPADRDPICTVRGAGFSDEDCYKILQGNARVLFPRLPRS